MITEKDIANFSADNEDIPPIFTANCDVLFDVNNVRYEVSLFAKNTMAVAYGTYNQTEPNTILLKDCVMREVANRNNIEVVLLELCVQIVNKIESRKSNTDDDFRNYLLDKLEKECVALREAAVVNDTYRRLAFSVRVEQTIEVALEYGIDREEIMNIKVLYECYE